MSYLKSRKQRTKINQSFSTWQELKSGVPQGSILGPLLFNIFINDMFFFIKDCKLANYADDTSVYSSNSNIEDLLESLENETSIVLDWFKINEMRPNADKCHLIICNQSNLSVKLDTKCIESDDSVELLGVHIDKHLNFSSHVSNLCKRANQKLHALARIAKFINEDKLKLIMKTFILSQFNYCPLIWMFTSRQLNHKINTLHERALRIVYKDTLLSFSDLLRKDDSFTIHERNLQKLAIEMFKIKNGLSPLPMQNLFTVKDYQHDLRSKRAWESHLIRTVKYGNETFSNWGPKYGKSYPTIFRTL